MVRVITQETYNDVVKENMEEFEMTLKDAIADAIKQFEAQGVDLTNIIKDIQTPESDDTCKALKDSILALRQMTRLKKTQEKPVEKSVVEKHEHNVTIIDHLDIIKKECDKDIAHRMFAERQGAYTALIRLMEQVSDDDDALAEKLVQTILSLMTGQPDPLDEVGVKLMMTYLENRKSPITQKLLLRWIKECCVKHERNRQAIFDAGIVEHLNGMLHQPSSQMLQEITAVLRALVLDDDIRVQYGRAHEHARIIASILICPIIALMKTYQKEELLVGDLMLTLASLLVRNEFCMKVDAAGGVRFILEALIDFHENEKLNRQGLKLLKALAGNDDCKMNIIKQGAAPIIASALDMHKDSDTTAIAGLSCVAALALRIPENSEALYTAGIPVVIIEIMKIHVNVMNVQRQASFAIRNMVSRSKDQSTYFLKLGAEGLLNNAMVNFPNCETDIKAALRDLGCTVAFREQWTGKGGKIDTEQRKQ